MHTLLSKTTKKKFYNKWLYKVSLDLPGYRVFEYKENIQKIISCESVHDLPTYGYFRQSYLNRDNLVSFYCFMSVYDRKSWAQRIERNFVDIYTNDRELFENISMSFSGLVRNRYEPDLDHLNELDNNRIFVNKYPHNRYQYKVFLRPHKMSRDKEAKSSWIKWVRLQKEKILMSNAVENWFFITDYNWDRRYIYVEDEKTLLLLKLRSSDVVGTIHEYHIKNK